jgi:hypothetical protein
MKYAARMFAIVVTMIPLLATAQMGTSRKLSAQVPFEFLAGNKLVPAGECIVQSAGTGGNTIQLSNWNAKISLFSVVSMGESQKGAGVDSLIFHRYGDRYFLSGMKLASTGATYRLPEGKAEAELRAQNVPATEEILLAALK